MNWCSFLIFLSAEISLYFMAVSNKIVKVSCVLLLGYELLFQPEVVRIYTSLLRESKNPSVLEAAAGAIQNLCAGRWTVSVACLQTDQLQLTLIQMWSIWNMVHFVA